MRRHHQVRGFSLPELLVSLAVLGILSTVALVHAGPDRIGQQLDGAAQAFQLAIDRARLAAQRSQQACGLALEEAFATGEAESALPPCKGAGMALPSALASGINVHSNLPQRLRFSTNGLLLDGGLIVFRHPGAHHRPCVVMSLPLGVTRQGIYGTDPSLDLNSQHCLPSP